MIKAITACTAEIDDVDTAVLEILTQLNTPQSLCAHSVGFISCYSEFIETGVIKAICKALPFDVIGCTTAGNAIPKAIGEMLCCLIVLTSNDLLFASGVSGSLAEVQEGPLAEAYQQTRAKLPGEPALMFAFTPMMRQVTSEILVEILNTINPKLPIFGAQAVDYIDITEFKDSYTLFNGEEQREAVAFTLVYGELQPSFFVTSLSNVNIQKQKATITKSEGNCVMEVNQMPLMTYLEKLGMLGLSQGTNLSFPFMVDYQDGIQPPVPRAMYSITSEGYVLFSGRMPVGATLAVGDMDYADVLHTTSEVLNKVMNKKSSCILLFSCLMRYIVLGVDTTAEMQLVCSTIGKGKSYHFAYTGGELCPVYNEEGGLVNRFHNCSFIVCVL
ncbi:MAG: FIST C-terminal domain-containing protein [Treponema sp.]|jgi:hypothetical protein|nr:FIST C-terminal domain-containing protein [Treponema sp.]